MAATPQIQLAQYGDKSQLAKLGSMRVTDNPATSVQTSKTMQGGRPTEQWKPLDPVALAIEAIASGRAQAPQHDVLGPLSPEENDHDQMFRELARMERTVQDFIRLAARPDAGPYTKAMAVAAIQNYSRYLMQVRGQTPFFDGV